MAPILRRLAKLEKHVSQTSLTSLKVAESVKEDEGDGEDGQ